jgi:hypothetical protein
MLSIEKINKRARSKWVQEPLLTALIGLNSKRYHKYIDTLNCASTLTYEGNKLTGRYCWNRWCKICNRIRTGMLINGYKAVLDKMPDKQLLTLTIPNCSADDLKGNILKMKQTIRKIVEFRRQVLKLPNIDAIRKIECTYNSTKNNYHPHFHFIVNNYNDAVFLRDHWLQHWPDANINGQDIREATKPIELFKYFTKLSSGSIEKIGTTGKIKIKNEYHYPEALDIIFDAIEGTRIIQPMGKIRMSKKIEEKPELITEELDNSINIESNENIIVFQWIGNNWLCRITGELLSGFVPCEKLSIFRSNIRYLPKVPTAA